MSVASETNFDQSNLKRSPFRLGYLVSHPIQYQAPMLRHIAETQTST